MAGILSVQAVVGDPRFDQSRLDTARVAVRVVTLDSGEKRVHAAQGCMQASEGVNDEVILNLADLGSMSGCLECGEWDLELETNTAAWLELGRDLKTVLDREGSGEPDERWREAVGLLFLARRAKSAVGEPMVELAEQAERRSRRALSGGANGGGGWVVVVDEETLVHPDPWREHLCAEVQRGCQVRFGEGVVVVVGQEPADTSGWGSGGVVLSGEGEDTLNVLDVALKLGSASTERVDEVWPSALRLVRAGEL